MQKINELKVLPIPEKLILDLQKNVFKVIEIKKEIDKALKPKSS
jgi:hypothetical protein